MSKAHDQWVRKLGLFVFSKKDVLDLSEFHVRFEVCNADNESPNNAAIRVYNLSNKTINLLTNNSEYKNVSLNAGYEGSGNYGLIFQGNIKQYRIGKENNVDSYVDILAADGDLSYTNSYMNESIAAGHTPIDAFNATAKSMKMDISYGLIKTTGQYVPSARGKTFLGMSRATARRTADTLNCRWSIQNGKIQVTDNQGYLNDQTVILNSETGLVGIPEQTDEGIRFKCLLNSKIRIGCWVKLKAVEINQTLWQNQEAAPLAYNSFNNNQNIAPTSTDETYCVFACEHAGDTRGNVWYSNIVGLAMDMTNKTVAGQ